MSAEKPVFPITITWHEDSEDEAFSNAIDAAVTLEWFDSRDEACPVTVKDSNANQVTLVVENLEVKLCELT